MSSATSTERSFMSWERRPQFVAAFLRGKEPNAMFQTKAVHMRQMVVHLNPLSREF